jgi:hypothetical protein
MKSHLATADLSGRAPVFVPLSLSAGVMREWCCDIKNLVTSGSCSHMYLACGAPEYHRDSPVQLKWWFLVCVTQATTGC